MLDQLLGVEISRCTIVPVPDCLSTALVHPAWEVQDSARHKQVACLDETGATTGVKRL